MSFMSYVIKLFLTCQTQHLCYSIGFFFFLTSLSSFSWGRLEFRLATGSIAGPRKNETTHWHVLTIGSFNFYNSYASIQVLVSVHQSSHQHRIESLLWQLEQGCYGSHMPSTVITVKVIKGVPGTSALSICCISFICLRL